MQLLPGTVDAPGSEVVVDGFPGWEVMREQAPGTAATHHVEDGIEDLAQGVHPRASRVSGCGEMGRDQGPLGVGEVGLVCSSHAR